MKAEGEKEREMDPDSIEEIAKKVRNTIRLSLQYEK